MSRPVVLGAHVSAAASKWILKRVSSADIADAVRHFRSIGAPGVADQLLRAISEMRAAEEMWDAAVAARGSAEAPKPEIATESERDTWVGTSAAAGLLGVTERRVRQLLADESLAGHRPAGRWLVSRASLDEYLIARTELTA